MTALRLARRLLGAALLAAAGSAAAVNYTFPGAMPASCSGSAGNYTCPATTFGAGDTVAIASPKPATITFTGNVDTNNLQLNTAGSADEVTIIVQGTLTLGYQTWLQAHVVANSVTTTTSEQRIGGSLTVLTGDLTLGYAARVDGHVRSVGGAITFADQARIGGHVVSNTGNVTLGFQSSVTGGITTGGNVTVDNESQISGAVNGQGGAVDLDYAARVSAVTTTSGSITLRGTVNASSCVRSAGSATITLNPADSVAGVCCGATCGTACVSNGSGGAMPPACSTGIVHVGSTSGHSASATNTLALTRPAGVAAGDVMLAWVTQATSSLPLGSTIASVPTGWTLVLTRDNGSSFGSALYRKVAGSSEAASYSWTFAANGRSAGGIVAFRGVDTGTPVETSDSQLNSASSTYTAPSVAPMGANRMIVSLFAAPNGNDLLGAPGGFALGAAPLSTGGSAGMAASAAFALQAAASATGNKTISGTRSQASVGALVALRPATDSSALGLPLYLRGSDAPSATLSTVAPIETTLGSVDTARDAADGLLLVRSTASASESDATKYQRWITGTAGITFSGNFRLRIWSAMSDFSTTDRGMLSAFLRDCDSAGNSCSGFASGSLNQQPWSGGSSTWVQRTITFSNVNYTVAAGRRLELKVVVGSSSAGDMRLAYDTTSYASVLESTNPPAVDHYELHLPSTTLACQPATVTVKACADTSSPCTNLATTLAGRTATLATSAGTLGSTTVTFDAGGTASTTLSHPTATNGASVSVTLSGEQTTATNARRCCPDGASCSAASSCSVTVNTAGFLIAATSGGAATTVPAQTAGTTSGSFVLRAVQTGTSSSACEAALTGATTVDWALQCQDPTTCSSGNRLTLTGSSATTVASNPASGVTATTAVPMTFDANGNAPFSFNYADVGRIQLSASKTVSGATLAGSSNAFVVRPASFSLSSIRQTASPNTANPGAGSATGGVFVKAGEAFSATVTALTSGGATAPNFGRESTPEGVLLTPTLVLPSGGTVGTLSNATIAGGSFTNGVATATTLAYGEVGVVTLTPSVADGSYLGAGAVSGSASGNVGRFVPARFALSGGSVTHRSGLSCSPASTFSYLGETFRLGLTLTAQNTAGATTANYTGAFARLDPTSASAWNLAGRDGTTVFTVAGGRLSLGSASGSWSNGVAANVAITAAALRASAPDGPFDAAFGVAPTDADGVAIASFDMASASGGTNDRARVGNVALRFGRLRLSSAIGAADRALALPAAAQHWNGSAWATNTLDSCTSVPASAFSFGNLRRTLTTADTAALGPINFAAGQGSLRLAAPGGGRSGTYDIALSLGTTATDASCLQPWSPASGEAATAGANLAHLRGAWCGSTYANDPAARAAFGRQRTQEHLIYRRENY